MRKRISDLLFYFLPGFVLGRHSTPQEANENSDSHSDPNLHLTNQSDDYHPMNPTDPIEVEKGIAKINTLIATAKRDEANIEMVLENQLELLLQKIYPDEKNTMRGTLRLVSLMPYYIFDRRASTMWAIDDIGFQTIWDKWEEDFFRPSSRSRYKDPLTLQYYSSVQTYSIFLHYYYTYGKRPKADQPEGSKNHPASAFSKIIKALLILTAPIESYADTKTAFKEKTADFLLFGRLLESAAKKLCCVPSTKTIDHEFANSILTMAYQIAISREAIPRIIVMSIRKRPRPKHIALAKEILNDMFINMKAHYYLYEGFWLNYIVCKSGDNDLAKFIFDAFSDAFFPKTRFNLVRTPSWDIAKICDSAIEYIKEITPKQSERLFSKDSYIRRMNLHAALLLLAKERLHWKTSDLETPLLKELTDDSTRKIETNVGIMLSNYGIIKPKMRSYRATGSVRSTEIFRSMSNQFIQTVSRVLLFNYIDLEKPFSVLPVELWFIICSFLMPEFLYQELLGENTQNEAEKTTIIRDLMQSMECLLKNTYFKKNSDRVDEHYKLKIIENMPKMFLYKNVKFASDYAMTPGAMMKTQEQLRKCSDYLTLSLTPLKKASKSNLFDLILKLTRGLILMVQKLQRLELCAPACDVMCKRVFSPLCSYLKKCESNESEKPIELIKFIKVYTRRLDQVQKENPVPNQIVFFKKTVALTQRLIAESQRILEENSRPKPEKSTFNISEAVNNI